MTQKISCSLKRQSTKTLLMKCRSSMISKIQNLKSNTKSFKTVILLRAEMIMRILMRDKAIFQYKLVFFRESDSSCNNLRKKIVSKMLERLYCLLRLNQQGLLIVEVLTQNLNSNRRPNTSAQFMQRFHLCKISIEISERSPKFLLLIY